jgi:hypothetical protein
VTHPAPERVFDGQTAQAGGRWPGGEEKGLRAGVGFADAAAAKSANSVGGRTADPAAHAARLQVCCSAIWGRDSGEVVGEALHQVARADDVEADLAGRLRQGFVTTVTAGS